MSHFAVLTGYTGGGEAYHNNVRMKTTDYGDVVEVYRDSAEHFDWAQLVEFKDGIINVLNQMPDDLEGGPYTEATASEIWGEE